MGFKRKMAGVVKVNPSGGVGQLVEK